MKIFPFVILGLFSANAFSQYEPEEFTELHVRHASKNHTSMRANMSSLASRHFIKPNSQLEIQFKKDHSTTHNNNIRLKISAVLENSKGEQRPLNVYGFSTVTKSSPGAAANPMPTNVRYDYNVTYLEVDGANLQNTDVDLSTEKLEEGDIIRLTILNTRKGSIGKTMVFEIDNYGWRHSPGAGFAWLKTQANKQINFVASPWLGYTFYYKPSKSATIGELLFVPSFGPEASVVQVGEKVNIGIGLQLSLLANTLKFSYGTLLGFEDKPGYFTVGLNFVNSIQTLTTLIGNGSSN